MDDDERMSPVDLDRLRSRCDGPPEKFISADSTDIAALFQRLARAAEAKGDDRAERFAERYEHFQYEVFPGTVIISRDQLLAAIEICEELEKP